MLAQLLNLQRPLLVFDLETTSTDKETARIVQYAHRIYRPDSTWADYHTLVDPLVEISDENAAVHGITNAIIQFGCAKCHKTAEEHITVCPQHPLKEAGCPFCDACPQWRQIPTFKQIGPSLHRGLQGVDFAGKSINFDIEVLDKNLERDCNLRLELDGVCVIDAHRLEQILDPRDLSTLYEKYTGQKAENAHDAMADVAMTAAVLIGQFNSLGERMTQTVPDMHRLLWPDRIDHDGKFVFNKHGEPCFGFGKHKNQPMRLNVDYLRWMSRQGGWSTTVRRVIDEALKGKFPERT